MVAETRTGPFTWQQMGNVERNKGRNNETKKQRN